MNNSTELDSEVIDEVEISSPPKYRLILFNDDVNSFDHVIISIITILQTEPEVAVKQAMLAHELGKCTIKSSDDKDELAQYHSQFANVNISTEVQ